MKKLLKQKEAQARFLFFDSMPNGGGLPENPRGMRDKMLTMLADIENSHFPHPEQEGFLFVSAIRRYLLSLPAEDDCLQGDDDAILTLMVTTPTPLLAQSFEDFIRNIEWEVEQDPNLSFLKEQQMLARDCVNAQQIYYGNLFDLWVMRELMLVAIELGAKL